MTIQLTDGQHESLERLAETDLACAKYARVILEEVDG